jgi:hypothetical protein
VLMESLHTGQSSGEQQQRVCGVWSSRKRPWEIWLENKVKCKATFRTSNVLFKSLVFVDSWELLKCTICLSMFKQGNDVTKSQILGK